MSSLRDLWSPIKLINQGIIPSPNGANLSFNTSAGILWGNGINWHNNQLSPNDVNISAKVPASFFYRTRTGGTSSSVTVIDPTKYDVGGVITSVGGAGSDDATNQRIYLYPTGVINVLYGQTRYANLAAAIAAIQSESFIPYPNAESTGILIGVISVRNDIVADGQPLTNTNYAKFTLVSKFGESFGGTGGLSTTTLQQAYDNSSNPEIIINAVLDGLSIQNGTGNADNVTRLLEGVNAADNATSFIRADGYISGTTFQTNGTFLNDGGITATTVSATTYYNLPTDITVTGGTYSSGTLKLRNNNLSTITVSGFNYLDTPFNSHTGDTSIHFTKSSITLSNIGNSAHTHTISEIVNLQSNLNNKFNITGGTISGDVIANYFYGDGSGLTNIIKRTEATKTTNDDGLYTIDSITGITSDTTRFIEVYVTAHLDINNYGFWKRTIGVMNIGGVSTVMIENYDTDKQSNGLNPTDVSFSGSGSNILIQISGELSKTYNWTSDWEIIKR
jgi:hypothetical protein